MLETYAVGVKLEMTSNVAGILDKLITDFEKFNVMVKETSSSLSRLGRNMRVDSSSMAGLDRMTSAMKTAEGAGAALNRTLRSNAEYASETAKAMQTSAKAMEQAARAARSSSSGSHGGGRFSEHNVMMGGMAAGMLGGVMLDAVRHTMTPAIDMSRTADVMAADTRLSPQQLAAAIGRAKETTRLAPGSTTGENLAAMLDLKGLFGDLEEAKEMLPEFARMTTLYQALDKKGGGSGEQSYAAGKALEVMAGMVDEHVDAQGHTVRTIDKQLGIKRLQAMERTAVATNMRVMPSDYLGFAKQARVAGMTLSDEFVYEKLPAIMQVLTGPRTGTALMSMAQVFKGDKLTDKSMAAMIEIGLAGPDGLVSVGGHRGRNGKMTKGKLKVNPDAIYDLPMMMHDPQLYLAEAQKRMEAKGIHGSEAQITALMRASQRSTIAGFFADLLKDMPVILKDQATNKAIRPDIAEHIAATDPAAKVQQFDAAMTNLATELGSAGMGDAMKVLYTATAGLNKLGEWARDNPGFARVAFDAGAGLGAIAAGLGTLSTAILVFGPALRLLGVAGAIKTAVAASPEAVAAAAGGAAALPLAVAGAGVAMAVDAGRDPLYAEKEKARQLAAGRASAAASGASPQSSGFVPGDGFGVDGRPIQMQGVVNLDGKKVGDFVTGYQARQAARAPAGQSGFDTRATAFPVGRAISP